MNEEEKCAWFADKKNSQTFLATINIVNVKGRYERYDHVTKNSLLLVTWKPKCIQEGFPIYKSSRIFHNLIDRDKCWTFLVKAFDLGYEKSSIVIPFVLGVYTYSKNGRDCCRPSNFFA